MEIQLRTKDHVRNTNIEFDSFKVICDINKSNLGGGIAMSGKSGLGQEVSR